MAHETERQRELHHQRHHPGGSYPPPLFVAELDGDIPPTSPDGTAVFEMPAETPLNSSSQVDSQPQEPVRRESDTPTQANPWAYFGPSDDASSTVAPTSTSRPPPEHQKFASSSASATATRKEHGGHSGHAGHGPDSLVPAMTGESSVSATDYPSGMRPETVSPVSPSALPSAFFPPPLNINKPGHPQSPPPQDTTSWNYKSYKPYSPGAEHQDAPRPFPNQDTSSPSKAAPATANVAYRPYRRPSFKEPAQEEQRPPRSSSGHISPPTQHASPPATSSAPPYPAGMAPHHIYMPPTPHIPEHARAGGSPRPQGAPVQGGSPAASPRPSFTSPVLPKPEEAVPLPRPRPPPPQSTEEQSRPEEFGMRPHPQGGPPPAPSHTLPASPPEPHANGFPQSPSPTSTGFSTGSPGNNYIHSPPPPLTAQSPSPLNAGRRTPQPYAVAAPAAPSSNSPQSGYQASQPDPPASSRTSKLASLPDEPTVPNSPPPAYADIAPTRPGTQPPTDTKASLFPQAPSSSSAPHTPQGHQFPMQPTYAPSHRPSPPTSHASYGSPPPQPFSASSLHPPPPLPPRPSSSGGPARPVPGFSGQPVPATYPAPPKKHHAPQHQPPPGGYQRPSTASTNKLFGGSAKKWLDKTNKLVENKVSEILQNHPDPKYRPQPGQYGYQGGSSGYAGPAPGPYVAGQPYYGPPQTQAQTQPPQGYPTQQQYAHPQGPPPSRPRP